MSELVDGFQPAYGVPVLLGLALAFLFPSSKAFVRPEDKRAYRVIQVFTLVGAIVGAKLAVLFGDLGWPMTPLESARQIVFSGRSITGGLIGGFLTAEALKPLLRYPLPPNDRFATVLPFSVAIGRVGCVLAGCCRGTPFDGAWAVVDADGVARHPAPVYEMLFSLAVGVVFVVLLRKGLLRGRLFAVYLMTYGAFRFLVEIVRDTPDVAWGLSGYQLLALSMLPLGLFGLLRRLPPLPEAEPLPTTPALEAP
ncbi:MAG: prolipoprotein diacylglyceryl transferase [Sandaracinaceae bacterium]|nr:prolipoprotein diacylglyceryl transferase [Sandaracinaceae bacterium]